MPTRKQRPDGEPPRDVTSSAPAISSPVMPERKTVEASETVRIVAIGASAGGLDAFIELLSVVPVESGLAFVLIQHLDPRHDSMLVDILGSTTSIPVQQVSDGMRIERDHVYVIPPDREMTLEGEVLRLAPRSSSVPHRPLDGFFRSLARDREGEAIGVVLSGSDADGALGLQAIRDAGGITFAQSTESAKFDVMPQAAAGAADFVLEPREIAERLVRIGRSVLAEEGESTTQAIDRILQLLHAHYQVDFSRFKRAGIERRLLRRVLLGDHASLSAYADSLQDNEAALETLYQDLLIGVTSFFRDPERFEALKAIVFPAIVRNRGPKDSVRIWVAGCSTGEEVYSLGIALLEFLAGKPGMPRVSIFGTDVNEKSLDAARTALYSPRSVGEMPPERLARFFSPVAGGYKISKELRQLCVFAAHDVTRDPPFSKIDVVMCCNVLIYFGVELQRKAVAFMQYALAPDGFLMLGSSENLRGAIHLATVSTKPLIYRKKSAPAGLKKAGVPPPQSPSEPAAAVEPNFPASSGGSADDDRFLAAQLAPCGVLVNDQMEITRFRGEVAPFLTFEPGEASLNLFRLVRDHELLAELRPAVGRAFRKRIAVRRNDILVVEGELRRRVAFQVVPYVVAASSPAQCWVLFEGTPDEKEKSDGTPVDEQTESAGLRHALAAVIEDRERLADQAAAAAEEAQSSDEELRSTNEELETAKEELESANEELVTLNDELQSRNTSLVSLNDDLENLLGALEIPIIFVGVDMAIRRFNVTAGVLLNLNVTAIGRPLAYAKSALDIAHLEKLIGAVIETATAADVEVKDASGEWRLLRIRPYRTGDGSVDGAIVAVLDINMLKRSVLAADEVARHATMLAEASALLSSSLDYETTLESLTRLSTAAFSDWCAVDLVNEDGSIRHLTVAHANPVLRELALQFQQAAFSEPDSAPGAPQALRLRTSVLLNDIAESELTGVQPAAKITQLMDALGVRSLISVPLIVRDKVLGTTTFSSSRRRYEEVDLRFAEELSQRAAVAIDTALLFREAQSANRYKDAFLGSVAHELRTPLTSILGWVQLASGNPTLQGEALTQVALSGSLLKVFTEDLLDVSRIREQKLRVDMAEVDLSAVVRSALEMTALSTAANGIQVRSRIDLAPALVHGDNVRLLQVVWNLLSNAFKFTPMDGSIEIALERDRDEARLSVSDTGIGISADFAPFVFDLFRQADNASSHTPGLGIGLAIVAEIIKLHGGKVRVESPGVGRGSTFIVTLPLLLPALTDIAAAPEASSGRLSAKRRKHES